MEKLREQLLSSSSRHLWEKIGVYHHHGIDVSLGALRTKNSCGIGEYLDLLPMIDWCCELKLDVLMLLPLNESNDDPSPYRSISSRALHPIYLSLESLPYLEDQSAIKGKLGQLRSLNETPRVEYHEVLYKKMGWLREYFEGNKKNFLQNHDFQQFKETYAWLESYALFKVFREKKKMHWLQWPLEMRSPSRAEYNEFVRDNQDELTFHIVLQFLCYEQLKNVKNYASAKKVFLKGDIPLLINPDSVDVWEEPHLFDLTMSAGSPPDLYNHEGQNWDCPLFNWEAMRKYTENYRWWKARLHFAENFYDIFRIDHIFGFFRIWAIPTNHSAKEGKFIPAAASDQVPQGKEALQCVHESTHMLPIGEDLGIAPTEVRQCLVALGIPGTKVIRWERKWETTKEFIPYAEYSPLSMTCVSTHDLEPLHLWWTAEPDDAKAFAHFKGWTYTPTLTFEQHKEILRDSHHTPSLFHINLLQDYLALFPELVWPDPKEERINTPGTVTPHNWTYRFRRTVEEMTAHEGLKALIREIIQ